jgi:hypothetical protein
MADAAVARITDAPDPDDDVDLDLDAEDTLLREAIGQPVRVRAGGKVITIPHPTDWPHTANTAAARTDFGTWAAEVMSPEDYGHFASLKLRNYQINALFEQVQKRTGAGPGKQRNSGPSSRPKRQR